MDPVLLPTQIYLFLFPHTTKHTPMEVHATFMGVSKSVVVDAEGTVAHLLRSLALAYNVKESYLAIRASGTRLSVLDACGVDVALSNTTLYDGAAVTAEPTMTPAQTARHLLLQQGVPPAEYGTALLSACGEGDHDMVTLLLETDRITGTLYDEAFKATAQAGQICCTEALRDVPKHIRLPDGVLSAETLNDAICVAAHNKHAGWLKRMALYVSVEEMVGTWTLPLVAAVEVGGNEEVVEFLLGLGARPAQCGGDAWDSSDSALHVAVEAGYIRRFAQCDIISTTDLSQDCSPLYRVRTLAMLRAFKCFHDAAFKRDVARSASTFSKASCLQSWASLLNHRRIDWGRVDEFDAEAWTPLVVSVSATAEVACLRAVLAWRCTAPRTDSYWYDLWREALRVAGLGEWERFALLSMGGVDVREVGCQGVSPASLAARTQDGRDALAKLGVVAEPNKRRPGWRRLRSCSDYDGIEYPSYFVRGWPAPAPFSMCLPLYYPVNGEGEYPRRQCRPVRKCKPIRSASKQAALHLQQQRRRAGKVRSKQRSERPVRV